MGGVGTCFIKLVGAEARSSLIGPSIIGPNYRHRERFVTAVFMCTSGKWGREVENSMSSLPLSVSLERLNSTCLNRLLLP
jgi:hypothetical protein